MSPAAGLKAAIDTMNGGDALLVADNAKIAADTVDDAADHAVVVTGLTAAGGKAAYLTADGLSVVTYKMNPDGTTFASESFPLAS